MYKLTDTFVLILLIFAVFLSVAYTALNKSFAVFFIYYDYITVVTTRHVKRSVGPIVKQKLLMLR